MFIKIYPEGPDLQERLKVLEGIFNLSLVPVAIDNFFWRKKKLIILLLSMIGDWDLYSKIGPLRAEII